MQLVKLTLLLAVAQALKHAPALDQECPDDWSYFQGICYYYSHGHVVQWAEVASECLSLHPAAQPVSIHDSATDDFLTGLAGRNHGTWIGLFRDHLYPNDFYWLDGSDVDYTVWGTGFPYDGYNCAFLESYSAVHGQWVSMPCTNTTLTYFCHVNASSVANN